LVLGGSNMEVLRASSFLMKTSIEYSDQNPEPHRV
jgi:hypothetical protein